MRPLRLLATAGLLSALAYGPSARAQGKPDRLAFEAPAEAPRPTTGTCLTPGTATGTLAANDVVAALFNTGALFYRYPTLSEGGYVVPASSGLSPVFSASLWVGGKVGGEVRAAATRYSGFEFVPGPAGSAVGCETLDRIYTVSTGDVALYAATRTATPDLRDWPVGLGAPTVDAGGAPVVPTSPEQVIDLAAGERPALSGGQTAFWTMNDLGPHPTTRSAPLGVRCR